MVYSESRSKRKRKDEEEIIVGGGNSSHSRSSLDTCDKGINAAHVVLPSAMFAGSGSGLSRQ